MTTVIIFDWDDTLIDIGKVLCSSQYLACKQILARQNEYPFTSTWSLPSQVQIEQHIGERFLDTIIPSIFPAIDYKIELHYIWAKELYSIFKNVYVEQSKQLFPNVIAMLKHLSEQGFELALATNKSRDLLEAEIISTKTPKSLFAHIVCGDDAIIGKNFKPKPDMLNIIQANYAPGTNFIMVGDRESDIIAANSSNNKTHTILISKSKEQHKVTADLTLAKVTDLDTSALKNM